MVLEIPLRMRIRFRGKKSGLSSRRDAGQILIYRDSPDGIGTGGNPGTHAQCVRGRATSVSVGTCTAEYIGNPRALCTPLSTRLAGARRILYRLSKLAIVGATKFLDIYYFAPTAPCTPLSTALLGVCVRARARGYEYNSRKAKDGEMQALAGART